MSSGLGARDGDIVEVSAALLAADFPLDAYVERLATALSAAMRCTASVSIPNRDGTLEVVTAMVDAVRRTEALSPEDSPVAAVLRSGKREMQDQPAAIAHVPASTGENVYAVISVERDGQDPWSREDLRALESVSRHLAIAVRSHSAHGLAPFRYPWFAVAAIAALVAVVLALTASTTLRAINTAQTAADAEHARLAHAIADDVNVRLRASENFATLAAELIGPERGDRARTFDLLERLLRARENSNIYGIGVFYAPDMFGGSTPLFGPYVAISRGTMHRVDNDSPAYNYPGLAWYRQAVRLHGAISFTPPYLEDNVRYVSAVRAFYRGGRLAGVVSIDSLAGRLVGALASHLPPDVTAAIVDREGRVLLDAGSTGNDPTTSVVASLDYAPWTLRLSSSTEPLRFAQQKIAITGAIVAAVTIAVGIALILLVNTIVSTRRAAAGLKIQRAELQSEIASRMDTEERLRSAAFHDTLTGLPNRAFFLKQLEDVLDQRQLTSGFEYAVLFIDLDRFYVVNDTMGHAVGDELLRAISFRLEEVLPPHALIARLGGDEFVLLLPSQASAITEAIAIAEDILEALRNPFTINDREVYSGASIGIVKVERAHTSAEDVLHDADISMYQAKRSGRSRYAVFDTWMREQMEYQLKLEGSLRGAVDRGEIVAYYQPIVRLRDDTIVGAELLARWHRDGEEHVTAGDFIPVAEQTGMLRAIDAELFEQVCRDAAELIPLAPGLVFSVNVSARDLTRASLLPDIDSTIERFGITPSAIKFEITETAVMEDAEHALAMLREIRRRGFEIVVDDFGAGYSSLSYLQRLPLAGLKIDRSFIASLPDDAQALEIVRAIVALGKALGMHITAEGVEHEGQLSLLRSMDVDFAQGFFFSRPLTFEAAKALFAGARTIEA